jgi:hypothetical protein
MILLLCALMNMMIMKISLINISVKIDGISEEGWMGFAQLFLLDGKEGKCPKFLLSGSHGKLCICHLKRKMSKSLFFWSFN